MVRDRLVRTRLTGAAIAIGLVVLPAAPAAAQSRSLPLVPDGVTVSDSVRKAISAEWLTDEERSALRVFHGVWDEPDLSTPDRRAFVALNAWRFDDPALSDPSVDVEWRAEAQLRQGALMEAIDLLDGRATSRAARIRAEAWEAMGEQDRAAAAVDARVLRLAEQPPDDAAELTEGVRAMMVRARIEGQPSRDFQSMLNLLGQAHQRLDRLYWPARLAEAGLLIEKSHENDAISALHETLQLNPRCAEAWYMLGRIALDRFDFASARTASDALRRLGRGHPLADLLDAESRLVQDDPDEAIDILTRLTRRWPQMRPAHALLAAAYAVTYDETAARAAIAAFEALSPGSARAYYETGRFLSINRQYDEAAVMLEEAIRRQPGWPAPQIELGLMELQSGRDARALDVLRGVTQLDPFNKRAANSLHLLEQLAEYVEIETEHFVVRYQPGVDSVLATMMPGPLERIHDIVTTRFNFEPPQKTIIELHPGHQRFAVRITGMPHVHTIAACTGPVIAMEAPKEGPPSQHQGIFDWVRVIQHEYTHTVTLAQTRNRIPHWLTEAAAVSMELVPRDYDTCLMLAHAYRDGTLFSLDEIKWAFVRPKQPGDRGKAYAQGHWMVEYMNERFGASALNRLLSRYFDGEREEQAMPGALGVTREAFFEGFLEWAGGQISAWGLAERPSLIELTDELREADPELREQMARSRQSRLDVIVREMTGQIGRPARTSRESLTADDWPPLVRPTVQVTDEELASWLAEYPDHPDLVELSVRRWISEAVEVGADEAIVPLLERYAQLRPVDPFPQKKLAQYWIESDDPARALDHLEALDIREQKTPVFAVELARLYRQTGRLDRAVEKIHRAVLINPYHAPNRELAAAITIEAGDLDSARAHVVALTMLEPDRPRHQKRLAALERMIAAQGG